jgi:hypothetical protein
MSEQYPPIPQRLVPAGGGGIGGTTQGEPYYPPTPQVGSPGGRPGTGNSGNSGPTGPGFNRQEFIKSYANLVARTWTDDQYLDLLVASPVEVLARAGMPTADGAVVRVIQVKLTGMGKIEDQVNAWIEGNRTGLYDFWLPIKPDDIDIDVGGGASAEGGASCCCTPCCCCT